MLNATARTSFSANFLNDCGQDGICVSDLVVSPALLLPKSKKLDNYIPKYVIHDKDSSLIINTFVLMYNY